MVLDAVAKSSNSTGGELDFKLIHGLMEVNISSDDDDDDDFICALSHTHIAVTENSDKKVSLEPPL